jgi:hypothetical protein
MIKRLLASTGLFVACLVGGAEAAGPTSASVKGGESVVIDSPTADFTITTQPQRGSADKVAPDVAGGPYKLKYTATNTTVAQTDKITYRVTGETADRVVDISIDPTSTSLGFSGQVYEQSGRALFLLFVLAIILESALALLFNWKPFVENLVPRAVRPVIAFIGAVIVVKLLDLDVVTTLTNAVNNTHFKVSPEGQIVTAMVIAGGSAGVNTMLVALGFRSVRTPETTAPKPPPEKAWLAIRALQGRAQGDLFVFVGPPTAGNQALLGIIKGRSKPGTLRSWFLTDRGRLPSYGGHTMLPDQDYLIEVRGKDAAGVPLPPATFGPLKFAKGALVDIDVTL